VQRKTKKSKRRGKRRVERVKRAASATRADATGDASDASPLTGNAAVGWTTERTMVETVEADHSMNTVEVDQAALIAEAQNAVASAPVDATQLPPDQAAQVEGERQPTQEEILKGYVIVAQTLVSGAQSALAPNWVLKPERKQKMSEALAQAAMLWFPDQVLPPKWAALLVIADAFSEIVADNYDTDAGEYRPLKLKLKNVTPPNPAQTEAV